MFKSAHKCPICRSHSRHCIRLTSAMYLEPVINCPAGGVLPRHVRAGDPIARENRAGPGSPRTSFVGWRRGGGRRLPRVHSRGRQQNTARFSPQPRGPRLICGGVEAKGWGRFSSFRCRSSLEDFRYSSFLTPGTEKNWLPAPPQQPSCLCTPYFLLFGSSPLLAK